ncbi:MAG: hypothetical protein O4965_17555 [Trichodesmium sp. St19_bin1]|nr:hypothetical protein [Trichodesmium sp. St19_bin1]
MNLGVSESIANNIFHYWIDILQELFYQLVCYKNSVRKKMSIYEYKKF